MVTQIEQKILDNFNCGNFRQSFKDLIVLYKKQKKTEYANQLGVIFQNLNKIKFATYFYKQSINIDSKNYKPYYNLAVLLKDLDPEESEKYIDECIKINSEEDILSVKCSILLKKFCYEKIINILEKKACLEQSYYLLAASYLALNNLKKSNFYFNKSIEKNNLEMNLLYLCSFPRVYKNSKEIIYFREKFSVQLKHINKLLDLKKFSRYDKKTILSLSTNFYLSYQQKNDLDLNIQYFKILDKINCINSKKKFTNKDFNKNKICFVSSFFRRHTVSKLFFNFIKELTLIENKEIHIIHTSRTEDNWTNEYKKLNLHYHISDNYDFIEKILITQKFSSVIFLDHAMSNITQKILINKLAEKYFILWGHPITTGCKHVDYFMLPKCMENNYHNKYSEKIIFLDEVGFNYKIDSNLKKNYQLQPIEKNFIVIQSLYKLLPKYDCIYGKIIEQLKDFKIFFIKDKDPYYTNILQSRLQLNKFTKKFNDRFVFIERMNQDEFYVNLQKYKIILDSVGWSGGNTTVEALYLDKPVICVEGDNLRSNHSAAILKFIGLDELVASNYREYIDLVIKIGKNEDFYNDIVKKIKKNKYKLFNSKTSLYKSLKNFI